VHKKLMVKTQISGLLKFHQFQQLTLLRLQPSATRIFIGVIDMSKQDSMFYVWIVNWHIHGDLSLTCYSGNKKFAAMYKAICYKSKIYWSISWS